MVGAVGLCSHDIPNLAKLKIRSAPWLVAGYDLNVETLDAIKAGAAQLTVGQTLTCKDTYPYSRSFDTWSKAKHWSRAGSTWVPRLLPRTMLTRSTSEKPMTRRKRSGMPTTSTRTSPILKRSLNHCHGSRFPDSHVGSRSFLRNGGIEEVMSEGDLIRLENITKRFDGVTALDKVSFSIRQGEVHAVVGENGAGKSTFIKILAGVHQPDGGQIISAGSL